MQKPSLGGIFISKYCGIFAANINFVKMKKETMLSLLFLVLLFVVTPSFAQISAGGTPSSFIFETNNKWLSSTLDLPIDFDVVAMRAEDAKRKLENLPPRVGKVIPVKLTTGNSGEWSTLPNGQEIWRLCLYAEDAIALMLTYDKFEIPEGGKLFIYNEDRSRILGAYTEENNPQRVEYATEFIAGDQITLEYVAPVSGSFDTPIIVSGVVFGYNNLYLTKQQKGDSTRAVLGESGWCMVNITCSEGNNWTDQKKGVVRIATPTGDGYYSVCSGSIVNNTAGNLDPLLLSAFHCYNTLTTAQMNQSIYYFNYEHPYCSGSSNPSVPTITGATMLVNNPLNGGSDGALLRLNEKIPASYGVYYNGWDRRNTAATSGVGIHHPNADVKKISTFTSSAQSKSNVNFGSGGITASNSMWGVAFVATTNGHGVTEGGSSGSPLFNQNKRIVGTLSGGSATCESPNGYNTFYGKLWYHWNQYSSQQMKPYLDPINSGAEYIDGTYTATVACNPPTNLTVTFTNDCKANLTWNAPAGKEGDSRAVLWDNTNINDQGYGQAAEWWTSGNNGRIVADDFDVTNSWSIEKITTYGFYSKTASGPAKMGVKIFKNNNGVPGTEIYSNNSLTVSVSSSIYTITLPTPFQISQSGKYWIAIYGVYNTTTPTTQAELEQKDFYVLYGGSTIGAQLKAKDYAGIFGGYDWKNVTQGAEGGPVISYYFKIEGTMSKAAYNVYRDGSAIATNITTTSYTDASFNISSGHTWSVKTICSSGESGSATATKPVCKTAVGDYELPEIVVFPNPTTGELTITNNELGSELNSGTNVEIFDIYGRKQEAESRRQKAEGEMVINISNLAAGIYFLKIDGQMVKVIKN